jgi:hypothetical protein
VTFCGSGNVTPEGSSTRTAQLRLGSPWLGAADDGDGLGAEAVAADGEAVAGGEADEAVADAA